MITATLLPTLAPLFDLRPEAYVYFRAVRDGMGQVTDFSVAYLNPAAHTLAQAAHGFTVGGFLRHEPQTTERECLFTDLCRLMATGQPSTISYRDPARQQELVMHHAQAGDGVLSRLHLATAANPAETKHTTLQAVIDNTQTGIFVIVPVIDDRGQHTDFRFVAINRMVTALVGQTPETMRGSVVSDWFTNYKQTGLFDRYKHTYDTGTDQRFTIHYNVDGFDVWFDVKAIKLGSEVMVTFSDYTDLKRAQQAVERQAELLNSVLDGSANGIMAFEAVRDGAGQITDFALLMTNEAGANLVNRSASDLPGERLLSLFPGAVAAGLFDNYVHATETGQPVQAEISHQEGEVNTWLAIATRQVRDGFVITFSDISAVKLAQQSVEQSANELRAIINSAQAAISLMRPVYSPAGELIDFRFRLANQALSEYVYQEPAALIDTLNSRWFPAYRTNGLFERYQRILNTGQTQHFSLHYRADGLDAWLNVTASRFGPDVLVTFSDFTDLKLLQQQLEVSVGELQRSNENLEQFAYVASHDLQEPLRKILGFGDIIQQDYSALVGEEGADLIRRMQSAAARMQVLIRDVLAYSRVATRREAIRQVDLNAVVADVLNDLETAVAEQQAVVQVSALPTLPGDPLQLRQLFQNLLSNALKFSRSPSVDPTGAGVNPSLITVTVQRVRGSDSGWFVLPDEAARFFYRIDVTDNGIGFDPQQAERIFQVFQRLHGRSNYQGTGIGLAIVKKVVDNHQGYIRAIGRPGKGATFRVLLPE